MVIRLKLPPIFREVRRDDRPYSSGWEKLLPRNSLRFCVRGVLQTDHDVSSLLVAHARFFLGTFADEPCPENIPNTTDSAVNIKHLKPDNWKKRFRIWSPNLHFPNRSSEPELHTLTLLLQRPCTDQPQWCQPFAFFLAAEPTSTKYHACKELWRPQQSPSARARPQPCRFQL